MRKIIYLLFCSLLIFAMLSQNAHAENKPISFCISGGVETNLDSLFDATYWMAGATLDINLSALPLMISPECHIVVYGFEFEYFRIVPAVVLNYKISSLFVGAGITKWWWLGSEAEWFDPSDLLLKVNAGYKGNRIRLSAFIITPFDHLFGRYYNRVGATLGFGF